MREFNYQCKELKKARMRKMEQNNNYLTKPDILYIDRQLSALVILRCVRTSSLTWRLSETTFSIITILMYSCSSKLEAQICEPHCVKVDCSINLPTIIPTDTQIHPLYSSFVHYIPCPFFGASYLLLTN